MNKKIKLSIGIPVFNESANLPKLLKSLENQLNPYTEIIISDNSSKDNSYKIMEDFKNNPKNSGNISIFKQEKI